MADTKAIKTHLEPFVREWLESQFGVTFSRKSLPLISCEGFHQFGGVSSDAKIVAAIRSSSGKTSGDKFPTGKANVIFKDLYFLGRIAAKTKLVVVTNKQFFDLIVKKMRGKLPPEIQIVYCALPADLAKLDYSVHKEASSEMDRGKEGFRKNVPSVIE